MASTVSNDIGEHKASLNIIGRFGFSIHCDPHTNCEQFFGPSGVYELYVDFKGADSFDSSVLGMLLLLRRKAMTQSVQ
ncbi:MAG: hypothetical protein Q8L39_04400 [Burkholderiales bacterium]|nr:hypothetical protein [Burkholderiales bacterium]